MSKDLREMSKDLRETSKDLRETSKVLRETSKDLRETSKVLRETSKDLRETSKNLRETSTPPHRPGGGHLLAALADVVPIGLRHPGRGLRQPGPDRGERLAADPPGPGVKVARAEPRAPLTSGGVRGDPHA